MSYKDDIPYQLAMDAHRGTSHVPDQRAEQERQGYHDRLSADWDNLAGLADTQEKKTALAQQFARYRENYKRLYIAVLSAKSRCVSTMIAGPANFNVRRAQKTNASADNRSRELIEFRQRALTAIRRVLRPEDQPILSSDANACERLADKVKAAEAQRDQMKAANAAARKSGQPAPYEPYQLTNLGANIRRLKERAAQVSKAQAKPDTVQQGSAARLEDCPSENRVRLFFPGKPGPEVIAKLKQRAFRWTPSLGCWQAYRNTWSLELAACVAQGPKPQTFAARVGDDSKVPLAPEFVAWVRTVAALNGKTEDDIWAAWNEHCRENTAMDQSPTKGEFCQWRNLRDPEGGGR
jgi:hypothetical protein